MSEKMRERLAEYAHEQWSDWMRYLFSKCGPLRDGALAIPVEFVERWTRQMNEPYSELPENEKESDRKEADGMLEVSAAKDLYDALEELARLAAMSVKVGGTLHPAIRNAQAALAKARGTNEPSPD